MVLRSKLARNGPMANEVVQRWPEAWAAVLVASVAIGSFLSILRLGSLPLYAGMACVGGTAAWIAYARFRARSERLAALAFLASLSLPLIALFAGVADVASRIARTFA